MLQIWVARAFKACHYLRKTQKPRPSLVTGPPINPAKSQTSLSYLYTQQTLALAEESWDCCANYQTSARCCQADSFLNSPVHFWQSKPLMTHDTWHMTLLAHSSHSSAAEVTGRNLDCERQGWISYYDGKQNKLRLGTRYPLIIWTGLRDVITGGGGEWHIKEGVAHVMLISV